MRRLKRRSRGGNGLRLSRALAAALLLAAPACSGHEGSAPSRGGAASPPESTADLCAATGCSLPSVCGGIGCGPCGCCGQCVDTCQNGQVMRCTGSPPWDLCYEPGETCASPGSCILDSDGGARCATSAADCPTIAAEYAAAVAALDLPAALPGSSGLAPGAYNPSCVPADCGIVAGHCELGLGACWYLGRPQPRLEELAKAYELLGCATATACDCPAAPASVACELDRDAGGGGGGVEPACIVR